MLLEIRVNEGVRLTLDGREVLCTPTWESAVAEVSQRSDCNNPLLLHAAEHVTLRVTGAVRSAVIASLSPCPELIDQLEDHFEGFGPDLDPIDVGNEIDGVPWGWTAIPLQEGEGYSDY